MVVVDRYFSQDFWALGAIPLGVALDVVVGKPRGWPDPVQPIKRLAGMAERGLRVAVSQRGGGARTERLASVVLWVVVVGLVASFAWLLTEILSQLGGPATLIGRALMIYGALKIRDFRRETLEISEAPSLYLARHRLALLIGRETSHLDAPGIIRACVERVGERSNRVITGPLFGLALLGPAGLWGYLAANTLARRVEARKVSDPDLGWAPRSCAWLVNYLPSRLTWLLISLSAALLNEDGVASFQAGLRDGRLNPGSETIWGKAAMISAVGVQLGGPAGEGGGLPIDRSAVRRALKIMLVVTVQATFLTLAATILLSWS